MSEGILIIKDIMLNEEIERIPYADTEDLIHTLLQYLNDGIIEYTIEETEENE